MIKINDKEYRKYNINISWGSFSSTLMGKKINGISPFIKFNINDSILIGLELIFSKEMFMETPINEKVDITRYLTDITYEDNNGWISIIIGNYTCYITRINEKNFILNFHVDYDDFDILNITINTDISIL